MTFLPSPISSLCGFALLLCSLGNYNGGSTTMSFAGSTTASVSSAASEPTLKPRSEEAKSGQLLVYVGTYTQKTSKGIYLFHLDLATGNLTAAGVSPESASPSFLAIHPNHRFLYAVNEIGNFRGTNSGAVSAYAIDPKTGGLTLLNQRPSEGSGPCHLIVDKRGKNVLVANYGSGSVSVLPIQPDGRLGKATAFIQHHGTSVDPRRQEGPHAHSMLLDAANRFAFAADLGLDKILIYRFDSNKGTLTPNSPAYAAVKPGSGPRHTAFHPNGHYAYVINEMGSTVTAFSYDAKTGALKSLQSVSTLPQGYTGDSTTAEVQLSPDGKFLYGSNRGHDSIVIFSIDPKTGLLTYVGHQSTEGKTPRNFCIDPSGTYLLAANQDSDSIVVFRIDPQTGLLSPTGNTAEVSMPVCIEMMPAAH
jgi:6-phosphogluconolactonase